LKSSIVAAVHSITPDMLDRVWQELDYWLDVCRVRQTVLTLSTCNVHCTNSYSCSFIPCKVCSCILQVWEIKQLWNLNNHLGTVYYLQEIQSLKG
jgi:hypothetical protein